jgi:CheY-like chemotaxis protein
MEARMQGAQRLESLGVLAGGIAHDFNNLLMAILGNAELARIKAAPESDIQRHLRAIADTSQQGAELCRQLLVYSGGRTLTMQPVDLNQVVQDTSSLLRVSISKKAEVELDLAKAPPTLAGDPSQLRQIVMNLVVNASEALGDQAGRIVLRTGTEALNQDSIDRYSVGSSPLAGDYVFIEVEDDGCGMDGTTRSRMFEPFFSTKFTGRGLGLAAVLGIVRGHKGVVELDSHEGKGTRIRVAFPALPTDPRQSSPSDHPTDWSCSGTVLVVDDEAGARSVAAGLLEAIGFQCLQASDGKQGVDLFRAEPEKFVLVVLDLIMPVLDGRECFRALREIRPDVPVLFVSGYGEDAVTAELSQSLHTGFLQKPFDFDDLMRRARNLIEH